MRKILTTAVASGLFLCAPASATIVSGQVIGGNSGGIFIKLDPPFTESNPDNTVGDDNFQDGNVYAFDEQQNLVATQVIEVDQGTDVQIGETVASHYIVFDPGPIRTVVATIDFDAPIFGVATSTTNLENSDFLAVVDEVNYNFDNLRGLEAGQDFISFLDADTLQINFQASTPGDSIRVFTQFSPQAEIPLPAAAWVFLAGLGGIVGSRRLKGA